MAGGYSHVKTDAFMVGTKSSTATMKVPVSDYRIRCSHQRGFAHSPCASPTMCPVSATVPSTEGTGSPPGHSPSGARANIAARFMTSRGDIVGTSDSREEYQAASVVSPAGGPWWPADAPRAGPLAD